MEHIKQLLQLMQISYEGTMLTLHYSQGVTSPLLNATQHYKSYLNIGTDQCGTAILIKNGITITNVKRLPSGKGIPALFQRTWIIHAYAPSGVEKGISFPCNRIHALQ
jgi:hypothetical protein